MSTDPHPQNLTAGLAAGLATGLAAGPVAPDDDQRTVPHDPAALPTAANDDAPTVQLEQTAAQAPAAAALAVPGFDAVRLHQIYRNAPYVLLFNLFACVVAATVLAGRIPWSMLSIWIGGGVCLSVALGADLRRSRDHLERDGVLRAWERRLAGGLAIQGALWLLLFVVTRFSAMAERIPLQMLAFAVTFTATVVFATSLRCYLALVPLTAIGQMLWMARAQPSLSEAIFVIALYLVVLVTGLLAFRRALLAGVAASRERRVLMAEQAALFDSSMVGMAHIRNGVFVRVNQELARIYGLEKTALEGAPTHLVYIDEASHQDTLDEARARSASGVLSYERVYTRPDGQRRTLRVQARPVAGSDHATDSIFTVIDITASRQSEKVLAAREQAYRALAETYRVITSTAPGLVWATDAAGRYTFLGERGCEEILGMPVADAAGKSFAELVTPLQVARDRAAFMRLLAGDMMRDHVSEIIKRNGERAFISTSGGPLHDAAGRITGTCGISIDVTGRERDAAALQRAQQMVSSAVESLSDGFALFGADGRISLCNQRFAGLMEPDKPMQDMLGMHIAEVLRYRLRHGQIIPPEFLGDAAAWMAFRLRHHHEADGVPTQYQVSDGRWFQSTKRRTPDGGVVAVYTDITALKRTEEAVRVLAQHDALTGLPNRRLLEDRLSQALARARRESSMVGLLLIDLDGFKPVNDRHGHRAGDEVLRVVAQRLRDCVRAVDTVARFGGDEFVIVLDSLAKPADAGAVAAKVIEALARPIEPVWMTVRATPHFNIGGSVGIAVYPQDGAESERLMRHADAAMYKAKEAGRGRFVYYSAPA